MAALDAARGWCATMGAPPKVGFRQAHACERSPRGHAIESMSAIYYLTNIEFGPGAVSTLPGGACRGGNRAAVPGQRPWACGERAARPRRVAPAGGDPPLPRRAAQPDREGGPRGGRGLQGCRVGRDRRARRRLADRSRQGRRADHHPRGAVRAIRRDPRRRAAHSADGGACRRHTDDGGDRGGGRARGAPDALRRPQARLHQPEPDSRSVSSAIPS